MMPAAAPAQPPAKGGGRRRKGCCAGCAPLPPHHPTCLKREAPRDELPRPRVVRLPPRRPRPCRRLGREEEALVRERDERRDGDAAAQVAGGGRGRGCVGPQAVRQERGEEAHGPGELRTAATRGLRSRGGRAGRGE